MAKSEAKFPCPVCASLCEVRLSKKDKPYLVCDPCGVQLFIRGPAGIEEFNRLIERADRKGLLARIEELAQRFRLACPECRCQFWIEQELVKTSTFDGSFKGFRCPQKDCDAIVPWEE